jgi:quercetin dioxygenase-like cupin family protein
MTSNRKRSFALIGAAVGALVLAGAAYAAVSQILAAGTMAHSDLFGGPANVTIRRLTIAPYEVLGWHHHPGVGAYTVVNRGTLVIEDGCGGETIYTAGQAFLEPPNRVHRGRNLTADEVETVQAFVVPAGTPFSISSQQLCGPPANVMACRGGGWMSFTHPRPFANQGDCEQYVITGR